MPEAADIKSRLEDVFSRIHRERMAGIPILNDRLSVEVLGVRETSGYWLGTLITPWFINLMMLPSTDEQRAAVAGVPRGGTVLHRFPAGRFEFIVGEEGELGRFAMCSLFSPVLEFEDQASARLAAETALEALFDASLDPDTPPAAAGGAGGTSAGPPTEARDSETQSPLSRRGFLGGRSPSSNEAPP